MERAQKGGGWGGGGGMPQVKGIHAHGDTHGDLKAKQLKETVASLGRRDEKC